MIDEAESRAHKQLGQIDFSPFIITQYRRWFGLCYKKKQSIGNNDI